MYLKIRDRLKHMSNTGSNFEMTGILLGQELRKRKTPQEKIAIIRQTMEPGMTVSHVARLHGIQPSQLFKWKNSIWKAA
uniref:Transposase n=1 Tax=Raoultella ornithinolytica TaxID=54291 RepID=A0A0M4L8T4_RAOOR|nr:transposase [Raoultella ornithinolytica]ALD82405.1 transposase [Raoultella ornithinolytica]